MQNYKTFTRQAHQGALRMVQGMLCEFILKEIIDTKGNFYDISDAMSVNCSVLYLMSHDKLETCSHKLETCCMCLLRNLMCTSVYM